jgi:hypothetical protein
LNGLTRFCTWEQGFPCYSEVVYIFIRFFKCCPGCTRYNNWFQHYNDIFHVISKSSTVSRHFQRYSKVFHVRASLWKLWWGLQSGKGMANRFFNDKAWKNIVYLFLWDLHLRLSQCIALTKDLQHQFIWLFLMDVQIIYIIFIPEQLSIMGIAQPNSYCCIWTSD